MIWVEEALSADLQLIRPQMHGFVVVTAYAHEHGFEVIPVDPLIFAQQLNLQGCSFRY